MANEAAPPRRSNRALAACVAAAVALTVADLGSKTWAEEHLSAARVGDAPEVCAADEDGFVRTQRVRRPGLVLVEDVFEFEYAENCGAAFGLLRQAPATVRIVVFGVAATAATVVLLWLFWAGRGGPWFAWSVPLVISGALGNLIDRMRYGYVVDFIHFHYERPILWMDRFDYPTFNVADIAITLGVICLLIDGMRAPREAVATEASAGAAQPASDAGQDEPVAEAAADTASALAPDGDRDVASDEGPAAS